MRVLVFFDLPVETAGDRKNYRMFRKFLLKKEFMMLQESVYAKLALNQTVAKSVMDAVRANKPDSGLVQMLVVTEKQFSKMECVVGEINSSVIDNDKRMIII